MSAAPPTLGRLQRALEAAWHSSTAYLGAERPGNPAYGQCYPTARLVELFHPDLRVVAGRVDTGNGIEDHFWNLGPDGTHVDLSWQQFPPGSVVVDFEPLDSELRPDGPGTRERCRLLRERVLARLAEP